jgi:drug/metabolite transporter (DMT)-like permease
LTSHTVPAAAGLVPAGRVLALQLGCGLLWGCSFLFIKLGSGEVAPLAIAAARGVIAATTLTVWLLLLRQRPLPYRTELVPWLVLGTCNGWVPNLLVAYALTQLPSGPAALIPAAGPLITALLAHLCFAEERLTGRRLAGLGLGLAGVALLVGPRLLSGGGSSLAALAMLGVAVTYAVGNIYARVLPASFGDPTRLAFGQQLVSGSVALVLALGLLGPSGLAPLGGHIPAMLMLGCLTTAIPIALYMRLLRAAGPTRAAMTGYLVPLVAVVVGIVVLGETPELRQLAGGGIILIGVFLVTVSRRGARAA